MVHQLKQERNRQLDFMKYLRFSHIHATDMLWFLFLSISRDNPFAECECSTGLHNQYQKHDFLHTQRRNRKLPLFVFIFMLLIACGSCFPYPYNLSLLFRATRRAQMWLQDCASLKLVTMHCTSPQKEYKFYVLQIAIYNHYIKMSG